MVVVGCTSWLFIELLGVELVLVFVLCPCAVMAWCRSGVTFSVYLNCNLSVRVSTKQKPGRAHYLVHRTLFNLLVEF